MSTSTLSHPEIAEATLQGPNGKLGFRLFNNEVCFKIAHDIFAGTTYTHVHFVEDVQTILDIGANIGAAAFFFATLYPKATLYALEPATQPFALLERNVASLPNVRTFPFGLYSTSKTVSLFGGRNDSVESSVFPTARTTSECEEVRLQSASQFLEEQGITKVDILKIDTEGCEVSILRSLEKYLPEVKVLYVEYHSDRDRRLIDAMLAETHVLWRGQVSLVHRGEFCYLKRELLPPESETHTCEILLPLE
jgi:FkbM family methyltransferase